MTLLSWATTREENSLVKNRGSGHIKLQGNEFLWEKKLKSSPKSGKIQGYTPEN